MTRLWPVLAALGVAGCAHPVPGDRPPDLRSVTSRAAGDWVVEDPENVLVIDSGRGRLYVELHPEIAPDAVGRIKLLTRRGTYDGLQFWRVSEDFVVQTGDPGNRDGGKTELPNLKPEFSFRLTSTMPHRVYARPQGVSAGFIGALPYVSVSEDAKPRRDDGSLHAWITYCSGVMGMGRDADLDTANSEIFFMLRAYPGLDRDYTPVGRLLIGQDILAAMTPGEPSAHPDIVVKAQILADMKDAPGIEVMNTRGAGFAARVDRARRRRGADFSICDVAVPARLTS